MACGGALNSVLEATRRIPNQLLIRTYQVEQVEEDYPTLLDWPSLHFPSGSILEDQTALVTQSFKSAARRLIRIVQGKKTVRDAIPDDGITMVANLVVHIQRPSGTISIEKFCCMSALSEFRDRQGTSLT